MEWKSIPTPGRPGAATAAAPDLRTARRQLLYIEGKVHAKSWPEVTTQLGEFWEQIAVAFEPCFPSDPPWDQLVIQVLPEGGQLKAHLAESANPMRTSPLIVNAIVELMSEQYEQLPDPDDSGEADALFDAGIASLRTLARDALLASLETPAANRAIRTFTLRHGLGVRIHWLSTDRAQPLAVTL